MLISNFESVSREELTQYLDRHSRNIAEILLDNGEISLLEQKVEDSLREQVSRILHRYEAHPDQKRDIEQRLMDFDDPKLGVAILQQAYLVKSEATEKSLISQLLGLANSSNKKTRELTVNALREAANSEFPRLQNLGCKVIFNSGQLSDVELIEFVRNEHLEFEHRLNASKALCAEKSWRAAQALETVVLVWSRLEDKEKDKHRKAMFDLAGDFRAFQDQPAEDTYDIVHMLYETLEGISQQRIREHDVKKIVQRAMASLPEPAMEYLDALPPAERTLSAIFTLGTIARHSSSATARLLRWLREMFDGTASFDSTQFKYVLQQFGRADWDQQVDAEFERLLKTVQESNVPGFDRDDIMNQLEEVREGKGNRSWVSTQNLLKQLAAEYGAWPELDDKQAWNLKRSFERGSRFVKMESLTASERDVLITSLRMTMDKSPWTGSAAWWMNSYRNWSGSDRLAILDALGYVAQQQQNPNVTKGIFRKLTEFFTQVSNTASGQEADLATRWLEKLSAPLLPSSVERID